MKILCAFALFLTLSGCHKDDKPVPPVPPDQVLMFHVENVNVDGSSERAELHRARIEGVLLTLQ